MSSSLVLLRFRTHLPSLRPRIGDFSRQFLWGTVACATFPSVTATLDLSSIRGAQIPPYHRRYYRGHTYVDHTRLSNNNNSSKLLNHGLHSDHPGISANSRYFHGGNVLLEEGGDKELSAKEKKKLAKAKAKAAMAAAAAENEKEADGGTVDGENKKDETETKEQLQVASEGTTTTTTAAPESPKEVNAETNPPSPSPPPSGGDKEQTGQVRRGEGPLTGENTNPTAEERKADAEAHKEGLYDPERPGWQNPLYHNNPDVNRMFPEQYESQEAFERAKNHEVNRAPPIQPEDGTMVGPKYLEDLADEMVNLTMLEMNELVNKLQEHYGLVDGMLEPEGGDGDGGDDNDDDEGEGVAPAQEKTVFELKLVSYDAKAKIKIIKEVRALAALGLKEAKEVVERVPSIIVKDLKKEDAEETKAKLEELGAVVEIV